MSDHQENRHDPMIALVSKIVAGYVSHNNVPPQ
jgi:predicted transcriptional regulator